MDFYLYAYFVYNVFCKRTVSIFLVNTVWFWITGWYLFASPVLFFQSIGLWATQKNYRMILSVCPPDFWKHKHMKNYMLWWYYSEKVRIVMNRVKSRLYYESLHKLKLLTNINYFCFFILYSLYNIHIFIEVWITRSDFDSKLRINKKLRIFRWLSYF